MNKYLEKLKETIDESLIWLALNAKQYLDNDSIDRIIKSSDIDYAELNLWHATFDIIMDLDWNAEFNAWYICWLKDAIKLYNKQIEEDGNN